MRRAVHLAVLLSLLPLAACAWRRSDRTVCPEYRAQPCLLDPDCAWDRARGCRVCRCPEVKAIGAPTRSYQAAESGASPPAPR